MFRPMCASDGERLTKTDALTGTHTYSFGLHDTNGNTVYTPGLAEQSGARTQVYHHDWRGSTRMVTDNVGAKLGGNLEYDAYGQRIGAPGAANSTEFQFAGAHGYQREPAGGEELGLDYLYQRYYDPAIGRFISRDPIGYAGGLNLYGYCEGDPVNSVDPSGQSGTGVVLLVNEVVVKPTIAAGAVAVGATTGAVGAAASQTAASFTWATKLTGAALVWMAKVTISPGGNHQTAVEAFRVAYANSPASTQSCNRGAQVQANRDYGIKVQNAFAGILQGRSKVFHLPGMTDRVVDVYVSGAAHEVKTGRISLSKEIESEIERDILLRKSGQVNEIFWHFFPNDKGTRHATRPLIDRLLKEKITIVWHNETY